MIRLLTILLLISLQATATVNATVPYWVRPHAINKQGVFSLTEPRLVATTYYVKTGGGTGSGLDDTNAWSYAKLNATSLSSGDTVKFKRGDSFFGALTVNAGVIYTNYGTGAKPVITGFTTLSSWTSLGSSLYRATLNTGTRLNMITVDGVIVAPGRFPNPNTTDGGYLAVVAHTPTSGPYQNMASSATLSGLTGTWTGAEIVIRKNSYTFDRAAITGQSGTTLNYVTPSNLEQDNGFGAFVQGSLSTLDLTNEWYYSSTAGTLTIYGNPSGKVVKASTVSNLVDINGKNNTQFLDLAFEGSDSSTFHIYGGSAGTIIKNCDMSYNFEAISTFESENKGSLLVEDCNIIQTASSAIQIYGDGNNTIRRTSVTYSNLLPGLPRPVQSNGYNTCYVQGSNNLIEYNSMLHSGGPCISFNGGNNNTVQYNLIQDYCNIICDFGGVYTNGPGVNNKAIGNIVLDGVGAYFGTPQPYYHSANGMYADESASGFTIQGNTIGRMSSNGIYIHVSANITVRGNTIFDCRDNSLSQNDDEYYGSHDNHDNRIASNIFYAKNISQNIVYAQTTLFDASDLWGFGSMDSNIIARPFMNCGTYGTRAGDVVNFYDMWGAQNKFSWDLHGMNCGNIKPFKETGTVGGNLFANSTVTSTSGFNAYSPISVATATALDGTALRVTGTPSTDSIAKQRFEIRFGAVSGVKTYRVSFSLLGTTDKENVQAFWIDDPGNYNRFGEWSYHPLRTTRVEDTIYVTTNASKTNMSLVFEVHPNFTPFYIDNVKLQEITGTAVNIDDSVRIEYNATSTGGDRLLGANYRSLQGTAYTNKAYLSAYSSLILRREINASPDANAGTNISLTLPNNFTALAGSGTDIDGSIAAYKWTQISGPNTASFSTTVIATPTVSALISGTYNFQLRVTDNAGFQDSAIVQVMVSDAANQLPQSLAGPDQTIQLPSNSVILSGSGTDPDGTITAYNWLQQAGPNTASISNANIASPTVSGMIAGTYIFRLRVTDNSGGQAFDMMTVQVNAADNIAPTANAGGDQTITLPLSSVTLTGSGTDVDGSITTYQWTKIAGPVLYTITSPTSASTTITGLVEGMYTFRLTVTDNAGATTYDDMNITVFPVYVPETRSIQVRGNYKVIQQ